MGSDDTFDYGGIFAMAMLYTFTIALHIMLPSKIVSGYCCDNRTFKPLIYRLNAVVVLAVIVLTLLYLPNNVLEIFAQDYYRVLASANFVGVGLSVLFLFVGKDEKYARCVTIDQVNSPVKQLVENKDRNQPLLLQFYVGKEWNPRYFGIDIKMFLYMIGAVNLHVNLLANWSIHSRSRMETAAELVSAPLLSWASNSSLAMWTYGCCLTWFIWEYMFFEQVHLYTYDLFAEKIGFKLTWGCLVFYPFFYCIGVYPIVHGGNENDISIPAAVSIATLFFLGWCITRGANMQKYYFKTMPQQRFVFFGLVEQKTIPGTRILCSGWWGVARHFNYCGEIIQAIALALPGYLMAKSITMMVIPFLYPLFYILLFVPRQIDDDRICRVKYGPNWDAYTTAVPFRIFPGVW